MPADRRFDGRMEPDAVPSDLAAALQRAGYRVAGPVGVGSHGPAWAAVGLPEGLAPGTRVVVTELAIPAGPPGDAMRERLEVLGALSHEHLAAIVEVVAVDGLEQRTAGRGPGRRPTRCAVLLAEVPGVNLAALLAARPPLSDGELVTLVVPLAQALAALHDCGLVHGDVSPANIVVRPDGRPVLVDLLGAITAQAGSADGPDAGGRGTPGFAAPETERGDRPKPPADVYAVSRTALAALAGGGSADLRDVLERAGSPDPATRPTALELAARCFATGTPEPLTLPDAAVLARTTLALLASEPSPRSAVTVRPSRSRHRKARPAWRQVVAGLSALGVLGAGVVVVATQVSGGPADPASTAEGTAAHVGKPAVPVGSGAGGSVPAPAPPDAREPADPVAAAVALTQRRAVLLTAGDPDSLADVEVVGGPAQLADLALLADLDEAGLRIRGLAADVVSARLVDVVAGDPPTRAHVAVRSALTAHRRVTADGVVSSEVPAQRARDVVLTLAWTSAGWRVVDVEPAAP
ncbi:MAG: protein kinase domain-containing protein [Cellulomonas sp.]